MAFTIETRAGVPVVVGYAGGCRPASSAEVELWKEATDLRAENEKLLAVLRDHMLENKAEIERLHVALRLFYEAYHGADGGEYSRMMRRASCNAEIILGIDRHNCLGCSQEAEECWVAPLRREGE